MDRDEQRGAGVARNVHPVGERDEGVVGARHDHAVFAGLLDARRAGAGRNRGRCPFPCSPFGPLVPVSMPPWPGSSTTSGRGSPPFVCGRPALGAAATGEPAVERDLAQKALAIGRDELEHEPRRRIDRRVDDEGLVDAHRLGQIEHDARAARHHQAEAERLDEAAAALAGFRRQREGHLRHVDHDPVRVGKREGVQVDLAAQIHDEPGLRFVAAEPGVGRDRRRIGRGRDHGPSAADAATAKISRGKPSSPPGQPSVATLRAPVLLH